MITLINSCINMYEPELYTKCNYLSKSDIIFTLKNYEHLHNWNKEKTERLLDIGSGDGSSTVNVLLPFYLDNIERITGIDVSPNMVKFASDRYKVSKVSFVEMDISTNKLRKEFIEEFDRIFSFHCIHWSDHQRRCAENIYNMLVPGGEMLLLITGRMLLFDAYEIQANKSKWLPYTKGFINISSYHKSKNPRIDFVNTLQEAGLTVTVSDSYIRTATFNNVSEQKEFIRALHPFVSQVPNDMADECIDDTLSILNDMCKNSDDKNNYGFKYELISAFGKKPY